MMPLLVLLASSLGQDRGGGPPGSALEITKVLSRAHLSGSLEYWGVCNFKEFYPDFPKLRVGPDHEGPPVDLLWEMFAADPEMRVAQERDGKIRMVERDVPDDLLNVKIHRLVFPDYPGAVMAMIAIEKTWEVRSFRAQHNIGPKGDWGPDFAWPGNVSPVPTRNVLGELDDVTVAEALDYVQQMYPGFWTYENCKNLEDPGKGRIVHFGFYENRPQEVYASQGQVKR